PFDIRWIFYHDSIIARRVLDVMSNLMEENIALCIGRQSSVIGSDNYDIAFISENIVDLNLFRRGGALVFPLYIYRKAKAPKKKNTPLTQLLMFEPEVEYEAILPNISQGVRKLLQDNFDLPFLNPLDGEKKIEGFGSKDIFYYTYAVLYSNTYRTKYAEFLKIYFPRVPFTKEYKLFIQLGKLGKQLADLHLLKSKELDKTISQFPIDGNNKVEKPRFDSSQCDNGKVWINKEQYFDGVKEEVWQYQIGGYQVCEKWLKDRKERTLTLDEIKTYCKIITALSKTIELQNEIDELYLKVENN
ncbi:MAG: type ISP restriction/modification enzyme, partial [Ignavibacteriaceae bacterium]|nr:type ISP restriction/modification enzyme [Ignavibacteriaceae bacterium]